jgi:hypothetical protein
MPPTCSRRSEPCPLHAGVGLELGEVDERHPAFEFSEPGLVDLAVGHELAAGEDVLGKEFAPLDLDAEGLLETEHDVEEVDRFGS